MKRGRDRIRECDFCHEALPSVDLFEDAHGNLVCQRCSDRRKAKREKVKEEA